MKIFAKLSFVLVIVCLAVASMGVGSASASATCRRDSRTADSCTMRARSDGTAAGRTRASFSIGAFISITCQMDATTNPVRTGDNSVTMASVSFTNCNSTACTVTRVTANNPGSWALTLSSSTGPNYPIGASTGGARIELSCFGSPGTIEVSSQTPTCTSASTLSFSSDISGSISISCSNVRWTATGSARTLLGDSGIATFTVTLTFTSNNRISIS